MTAIPKTTNTTRKTKRSKRLIRATKKLSSFIKTPRQQNRRSRPNKTLKEPSPLHPTILYPNRHWLPLPCLFQSQLHHISSSTRSQLTLRTTTNPRMIPIHRRAKTHHHSSTSPCLDRQAKTPHLLLCSTGQPPHPRLLRRNFRLHIRRYHHQNTAQPMTRLATLNLLFKKIPPA